MAKSKKNVTDIKKARARAQTRKRGQRQIVVKDGFNTQDILQLNANIDVLLSEPEKLNRSMFQWANFIKKKIEKTVKEYRETIAKLKDHESYQESLRAIPMNTTQQDAERMLKEKFPKYFAELAKLWEKEVELEIEAARVDWLEFCQPQPGLAGLLAQDMFDNPESMLDLIYK